MGASIALVAPAVLAGIFNIPRIEGITNTVVHRPLPQQATYQFQPVGGDPILGRKVERMLEDVLKSRGFVRVEQGGDLTVAYAFDAVLDREVSSARTFIYTPPQTATVTGSRITTGSYSSTSARVTSPGSYSTSTTRVDTTQLYAKTIGVRISETGSGATLWEGLTTETGWCNQILVTTPDILSALFDKFPNELTNVRKKVGSKDPVAKQLRALFPEGTDWGCK